MRRSMAALAAAASLMSVGAAKAAAINLVTNGSFETPVIASGTYYNLGPAGADHPIPAGFGWSVPVNNVDIVSFGFAGSSAAYVDGTQGLDLVGYGSTGGISQLLGTTAGLSYRLTFSYANNPFGGAMTAAAAIALDGQLLATVTHGSSSIANFDWQTYSTVFTATGPTTLSFTETLGGGNAGLMLDSVSVSALDSVSLDVRAVPEPATWLLMIVGFGGLALAVRGREAAVMSSAA